MARPNAFDIRIQVKGAREIAQRADLRVIRPIILIIMNETLRRIGGAFVPILQKHTPVGRDSRHPLSTRPRRVGQSLRAGTRFHIENAENENMQLVVTQGARSFSGDQYGKFVRDGTPPHIIEARPGGVLAFTMGNGAVVVTKRVRHPGTQANPYHIRAMEEGRPMMQGFMQDGAKRITERIAEVAPHRGG